MISISVCIVYSGVLWCVLGLRTTYGRKRYSYDRSWGRSAGVRVGEGVLVPNAGGWNRNTLRTLSLRQINSCTCFNLSIFVPFDTCPPSCQAANTSRNGFLDLDFPGKTSPGPL